MPKNSNRRNDVRRANKDRRSRLDEMRRQQRAVERRKNFLTFGSAIAVALILVGTAVWLIPTPGGYLLLGHSESLLDRATEFEPVSAAGGVVYRKRAAA